MSQFARLLLLWLVLTAHVSMAAADNAAQPAGGQVALTDAERAYLAQKGPIKMCVQPDWLPYERINEKGRHEGIGAELMALMSERLGITLVLQPTKVWSESVAALRSRQCDILSMSANVPNRRDVMNFSRPYIVEPLVIATQSKELFIKDGSEIGTRKIGIIKGYVFVAMLRNRYPGIQITEVQSAQDGLERVRKGELWGYIDTMPTIAYSLQKFSMLDLKISGKLDFTLDLCVTSRNDEPLLAGIMQKAADSISDQERRDIINKWISVRMEHGFDYALLWKIAGAMGLLLLGVAGWNRKLAKFNHQISEKNLLIAKQHQVVTQTLEQVAALLDNSGQGFLSFGADLLVTGKFSRACISLLGGTPTGQAVDELLFPNQALQRKLMRDCIQDALAETDPQRQALFLSIIPTELQVADKMLKAEFIPIDNRIMAVLSDVTETRKLAQKVTQETRRMEMILAAVTDGPDFFATVDEFRAFAQAGQLPWRTQSEADLYRAIHTFKGSFNQFGFQHLPAALHETESALQARKGQTPGGPAGSHAAALVFATRWTHLLNLDLATVMDALGEDYVNRGGAVTLSPEQARRFEQLAAEFLKMPALSGPQRAIAAELAQLRWVSLSQELKGFDRLIQQLAARLGKEVGPLAVEGEDIRLDPDVFGSFLRSLGHIFRNAVDHGIEDPETRFAAAKSELGTITCRISRTALQLLLEISDDGTSIDEAALRRRAQQLAADNVTDGSLVDLVLADGISSRETATELSGRGVGMAAVKAEVTRLGGEVRLQSRAAQGTSFIFRIPLSNTARSAA
jgi:two-component sensor histidine kinase